MFLYILHLASEVKDGIRLKLRSNSIQLAHKDTVLHHCVCIRLCMYTDEGF